jgi:dihydrofolate reductase
VAAAEPPAVVQELRETDGGDIVVLSSSSVIKSLLRAGELDRLSIMLCPEIVGGGARLFDDGLPSSGWTLAEAITHETGAMNLLYDRKVTTP